MTSGANPAANRSEKSDDLQVGEKSLEVRLL